MNEGEVVLKQLRKKRILPMFGVLALAAGIFQTNLLAEDPVPGVGKPNEAAVQAAESFAGNQVLHILVGHSVVIRTQSRLRRVLVGNPAVVTTATTAPNELVVTAATPGSSSVILWQEDNQSRILEVFGDLDVSMLREAVARSFPKEPIQVEAEEGRVVLTGVASAPPIADQINKMAAPFSKEIVNSILIARPGRQKQILLKVRFAQVDRTKITAFGLNVFSTAGKGLGSGSTQQFSPPQPIRDKNDVLTVGLNDFLNLFYFNPQVNIGATLKDLEQKNVLQILAEPNLLAADGETAKFLAGGELPYPIVSGNVNGQSTITVQFKPFGVKLEFVGNIEDDNTIRLKVFPEVSSLDFSNAVQINGFTLPAIATRHAETVVELQNGQSFGIAGLLDQRTTLQYSKMPGIGDLPIIGALFRSKSINKVNSELMVIVTPVIIDPASSAGAAPPELPKPTVPNMDSKEFDKKFPTGSK
ncbi:MAG TPA: pilus assembly protein N-terminal domain-containing protein [Candidatus Angelobacter sp.]|nr:pilus assembly protein N-terminal domain-containing protein [Candidatus Angelobacter sp.]